MFGVVGHVMHLRTHLGKTVEGGQAHQIQAKVETIVQVPGSEDVHRTALFSHYDRVLQRVMEKLFLSCCTPD